MGIPSGSFCWYLCWRWIVGCSLHSWGTLTFSIRTITTDTSCYYFFSRPIECIFFFLCWQRITEIAGVVLSFDPKPIQVKVISSILDSPWAFFFFWCFSFFLCTISCISLCNFWSLLQRLGLTFPFLLPCTTRVIGMELVLTQITGFVSHFFVFNRIF